MPHKHALITAAPAAVACLPCGPSDAEDSPQSERPLPAARLTASRRGSGQTGSSQKQFPIVNFHGENAATCGKLFGICGPSVLTPSGSQRHETRGQSGIRKKTRSPVPKNHSMVTCESLRGDPFFPDPFYRSR